MKKMATIGFPIMIQYLLTSSIGLITSMMAGHLGDKTIAALGIGNQIFFVYSLVVFGLFAGAGVLMAQLFGTGDLTSIRKTILVSALIGVSVGVLFFVLEKTIVNDVSRCFTTDHEVIALVKSYMDAIIPSYLLLPIFLAFSTGFRSTQRSLRPMVISFLSVLVNVALAYALINGYFGMPKAGIAGVGYAILGARCLETVIMLLVVQRSNLSIKLKEMFDVNIQTTGVVVKTALPVIINELCWGLGMVIYNVLYGHIGLKALTAVQMNSVLQNFFMTLVFGASGATAILVGNSIGAGNLQEAKAVAHAILKISLPVSAVTGILMIASARGIIPLYSVSEETAQSFLAIAWIAGIMMPVKFFAVLMITGILRGGGDTVYTMYLELGTMWLIGVPIALLAVYVFKWPVHMAFAAVFIEDIVKCVLAYKRYHTKKWITDVTSGLI